MVKLLDLYACQGGAGVGYERAGFDVYAVDLEGKHANRNPHPFHHGSALDVLDTLLHGDSIAFARKDGTFNVPLETPPHPRHGAEQVGGVYGGSRRAKGDNPTPAQDRYAARYERGGGYVPRSRAVQQRLLGIDWMSQYGMYQSLPPVYTEWIGHQLIKAAAAIRPDQAPEVAA